MKKLKWTITVGRFPELEVPEEEATEEQIEEYEKALEKRIDTLREITKQLENVHLISKRAIRRVKRIPKTALFRLKVGKDLYFTGYNFTRGGGKIEISSGVDAFRTHGFACSVYSFLKARGEAKRFKHPEFILGTKTEKFSNDVVWHIVNHDRHATPLYGPTPRFVNLLQKDLKDLLSHMSTPTAAGRGFVKMDDNIEVSQMPREKGNGIQIYYHRTKSENPNVTDPPAEILPLVLYSYWSGESRKPNCSLTYSHVEPFALPKKFKVR